MKAQRIAVAMSGGVDSSVAADVLVGQGYEVVGLTMAIWPHEGAKPLAGPNGSCGADAIEAARQVAEALGIPHHVFDLREPFQRSVIDPFCDEYSRGRTPNPCVRCNLFLKFGELLRRAEQVGAGRLATGHYARASYDEKRERWVLRRGVDTAKDQSYSLYALRQEQLARAVFPLGEMQKSETRRRAAQLGLSTAERPESQEICFIAGDGYREYLRRRRPDLARPGPIVDREGRQLGRHLGIAFYTIGQRRGLRVASGKPLYVLGIDAQANRLIVGGEEEVKFSGLLMRDVNFVSLPSLPRNGKKLRVKLRSAAPLTACTAWPEGGRVRLEFVRPQPAVSPGQAAVCYAGDAVALGGTIQSAF